MTDRQGASHKEILRTVKEFLNELWRKYEYDPLSINKKYLYKLEKRLPEGCQYETKYCLKTKEVKENGRTSHVFTYGRHRDEEKPRTSFHSFLIKTPDNTRYLIGYAGKWVRIASFSEEKYTRKRIIRTQRKWANKRTPYSVNTKQNHSMEIY